MPSVPPRARRGIAAVVSGLLHVAVLLIAMFDLGLFDRFAPVMEAAIPVEIVMMPPPEEAEAAPPPPAPEQPQEPELEESVPEPPEVVPPEVVPPEPEVAAPEAPGGEKVAPEEIAEVPEAEEAEADDAEEAPAEAEAPEEVAALPPDAEAVPQPRSQERPVARPKPPPAPRPVRETAAAAARKYIGEWVLEPLRVNYGHRCGAAKLTGRLRLTSQDRPGRFLGELRTTIVWARCPAEGARYQVLLSIKNGRVLMTGSGGFVDRGVIRDGVMRLTDSYGASVWRKR
ncbi:MAG: hypothetical protein QNJ94_15105 [Alphaproteobacteria bacterium]|nr:hypothetical protein [Alphaproteobacteria bacterium]